MTAARKTRRTRLGSAPGRRISHTPMTQTTTTAGRRPSTLGGRSPHRPRPGRALCTKVPSTEAASAPCAAKKSPSVSGTALNPITAATASAAKRREDRSGSGPADVATSTPASATAPTMHTVLIDRPSAAPRNRPAMRARRGVSAPLASTASAQVQASVQSPSGRYSRELRKNPGHTAVSTTAQQRRRPPVERARDERAPRTT